MQIEAKRSKNFVILATIVFTIWVMMFLALFIWVLLSLINGQHDTKSNEFLADIILEIACLSIVVFFAAVEFALIYRYKYQVDIYTENKMYRQRKNKVIFEIKYENIKKIRIAPGILGGLFLFCEKSFIQKGIQKGRKTFDEQYNQKDIAKIIAIISRNNKSLIGIDEK